jgi:hypothetical protein|tara:strand:- start:2621 stop:2917 length:297 start_codon:yes stop_codon:yes gene_type:complete
MSFWNKLKGFLGLPTQESAEVTKVKKLLKEAEIIDAAIEEATVELKPLTSAKTVKEGVVPVTPKRARTKKGRYVADDKSTPDVNEAWVGGKAPKKKKK